MLRLVKPSGHIRRANDGLHFDDINKLLAAFRALIDAGASLLVIERNLDVIKTADYIIGSRSGRRRSRADMSSLPVRRDRAWSRLHRTPEDT